MNKYLIIPDCSDLNRGDQALIWETVGIAREAGFHGEYYLQNAGKQCSQSIAEGIKCFNPILPHPSRGRGENNVSYKSVMLKWGLRALGDLISSLWILLICKRPQLCRMFLNKKQNETLVLFRNASAVFVKGGGFLHSFGGVTSFYFIYYHLYAINLANAMGLPVLIMPNSFGPINGFLCKWQVKRALKKCKVIYCREHVSYEYMHKHFSQIEFYESFDLGLYLKPEKVGSIVEFPDEMPKVALTVRPYRFPEHENGTQLYQNYIDGMRQFIQWLIDNNYYPVMVQHTLAENAHEDDMKAIDDIRKVLPDGGYSVFADKSFNCRQMKALYSKFDYIVGTRFHSVIFSLMEGVPAMAIAYGGNKTRGIMAGIGLSEYVIGIDEIDKEKLISIFKKMVANRQSIKTILSQFEATVENERNSIINSIKRFS